MSIWNTKIGDLTKTTTSNPQPKAEKKKPISWGTALVIALPIAAIILLAIAWSIQGSSGDAIGPIRHETQLKAEPTPQSVEAEIAQSNSGGHYTEQIKTSVEYQSVDEMMKAMSQIASWLPLMTLIIVLGMIVGLFMGFGRLFRD